MIATVLSVLLPVALVVLTLTVLHRRGQAPWQARGEPPAGLGEDRQRLIDDWRRASSWPRRPWREARIKSSALDRFTGYPFPELPPLHKERYRISRGGRTEFDGLTMLAFQCDFRKSSNRTGPYHPVMIVSMDVPQWNARVAVYRTPPGRTTSFRLGDPAFDAALTVRTTDEAFARRVLGADLARWLVTDRHYAGLNFVLENGTLSTWLHGDFDEQALDLLTEALVQFRRRIPHER